MGPRIIRYGRVGGPNLFKEYAAHRGRCGGRIWRNYGGHRFWVAPEDKVRTYVPDNDPVTWSWRGQTLVVRQAADRLTRLAKELRLSFAPGGALRVRHRLINQGRRAVRCAPWALTVLAPGGVAILPQEPFLSQPAALLPVRPLALWAYTNMADPRWTWGKREIRLRQDARARTPQKIGFLNQPGWMAYARNGLLFVKRHAVRSGAVYPDFGCNLETYTDRHMLELESLGPLVNVPPGRQVDHDETWGLFRCPAVPTLAQVRLRAARVPLPPP